MTRQRLARDVEAAELEGIASHDLPVEVLRSSSDLAAARGRTSDRLALEELLSVSFAGEESWSLHGFCQACRRAVAFKGDWRYSGGGPVNFREHLVCPSCRLSNRKRFMAHVLAVRTRSGKTRGATYLYEQVTPFYAWAKRALPGVVVGSEYLGVRYLSGTTIGDVRHEDALALSFGDASFDSIASCDVFEHVPDIDRCLAECARVLAPGGRLYFTIPIHDTPKTVRRATIRGGDVFELLPPRYHANPVDPSGALVFYDHGWDILERCRSAGFVDVYALGYWSLLYGYLGNGLQLTFVAEASS